MSVASMSELPHFDSKELLPSINSSSISGGSIRSPSVRMKYHVQKAKELTKTESNDQTMKGAEFSDHITMKSPYSTISKLTGVTKSNVPQYNIAKVIP